MQKNNEDSKNLGSKTDKEQVLKTLKNLGQGFKLDDDGNKSKVSEASQLKALGLLVDILGLKGVKQVNIRHDLNFLNRVSDRPFMLPSKQRDIKTINRASNK